MEVVCVGGLTPTKITFQPLRDVLADTPLIFHDFAAYADAIDETYDLETEFRALDMALDTVGADRVHFIGNSAGASIVIAYALRNPRRVRSVAAWEPPFIGNDTSWSEQYRTFLNSLDSALLDFRGSERQRAFLRALTPRSQDVPPLGEAPAWLAHRSERQEYLWRSFRRASNAYDNLSRLTRHIYLAIGGRSHPIFQQIAERLASTCNAQVEMYAELNHFGGAPQVQPVRFARALRSIWESSPIDETQRSDDAGGRPL